MQVPVPTVMILPGLAMAVRAHEAGRLTALRAACADRPGRLGFADSLRDVLACGPLTYPHVALGDCGLNGAVRREPDQAARRAICGWLQ